MPSVLVKDGYVAVSGGFVVTVDGGDPDSAPCCCGSTQLWQRYKDCCRNQFAWFRDGLCPTIKYGDRCYFSVGPVLTTQEVKAQFPRERMYGGEGTCAAGGCLDPICPPCPDDCCYTTPPTSPCPNSDCTCLATGCDCGKKWNVVWNATGGGDGYDCSNGKHCATRFYQGSGSVTWTYTEIAPGICDLLMSNASGSLFLQRTVHNSCGGSSDAPDTINVTPANRDYIYGGLIGCGQTYVDVRAMIDRMSDFKTPGTSNKTVISPCFYDVPGLQGAGADCDPACTTDFDQNCGDQVGQPGLHFHHAGTKGCGGGGYTATGTAQCDLGCATAGTCNHTLTWGVFVQIPCGNDKGDIDKLGGSGTLAPPPTAGSTF